MPAGTRSKRASRYAAKSSARNLSLEQHLADLAPREALQRLLEALRRVSPEPRRWQHHPLHQYRTLYSKSVGR
eukprot:1694807-Rhodomonas_salina.2